MFDTGNAIKYLKDDRLNRDKFAENIGDAILKSQSTESFVIGLIGKWGSGKTSIVNMVIDHLNKSASYKPGKKPVIVEFNPWNFSDQNQLVSQFFNKLSVSLGRNNSSEDLEDVADLLKKLGKIFILGKYLPVPVLSQFITASADVCEAAGDATESLSKLLEEDLSAIKSEISNILEKQDKKVIIVMDDIDRLNDSEIRQVFQLVKSLADFPNTVYLLTFDREVVVKALDRDQLKCGDEYLEKIVQVPIEIPLLLKPDLEVILCEAV